MFYIPPVIYFHVDYLFQAAPSRLPALRINKLQDGAMYKVSRDCNRNFGILNLRRDSALRI